MSASEAWCNAIGQYVLTLGAAMLGAVLSGATPFGWSFGFWFAITSGFTALGIFLTTPWPRRWVLDKATRPVRPG